MMTESVNEHPRNQIMNNINYSPRIVFGPPAQCAPSYALPKRGKLGGITHWLRCH